MQIDLSIAAAQRQSFGVMFNHSSRDASIVRQILAGQIELAPHPTWRFETEIDWHADPFADRNWRAQLHMLRWMDPLRRRAERGDHRAADFWVRHAKSWIDQNPPGRRAAPEAWLNMVDGLRALELCLAVPFVARDHPEALSWLGASIRAHADWIIDERHLGHSNHALHQHQGLFVCGAVLGDHDALSLAEKRLEELFTSAYDDEGINAEGSIFYHLANFNWWSMAHRRIEAEGRQVPARMRLLDQVPIELAHATKPSGQFVSIGDTDGGSASRVDHPATRWVSSAGADGEPPEESFRVYRAGYVFARSGWGDQERTFEDETFWSARFGPANRVHGHPDGTSMTFSSMGHEWITDPGKFQYGQSKMREYCLSRAAHSLVSLKNRAYDPSSSVECVRQDITSSTIDLTFLDNGYEGARISRRIIYSRSGEYAVVIDAVDSEDEVDAVQNWQCGAGTTATQHAQGFQLDDSDGRRAVVLFTGTRPAMDLVEGDDEPVGGWVATGWKTREAAPSLRFSKSGRRFRFITLLAAGFRGAVPTLETVRSTAKGRVRLRVTTGRISEQLVIEPKRARLIGFSDDPDVELRRSSRPGAPVLNPLDRKVRARLFAAMRDARSSAWETGEESVRSASAAELEALRDSFDIRDGVDLGLGATIADLRRSSRPRAELQDVRRDRPGLINWDEDPKYRPTITNAPLHSLRGVDAAVPDLREDTILTYSLGSLLLPALVCPADGDTLTVMFQGAVDRARITPPIFQRVRYQKGLRAGPTVVFADPTLDLSTELRLGWYLGSEDVDIAVSIARAVEKLRDRFGARKIVLQGGSGGGFAALQVGARLPGSHVVAANPQTDLRRYNAVAYRAAMVSAFGVKQAPKDPSVLRRIDVMHLMSKTRSPMSITLVMNKGDIYHERHHATPLRRAVEGMPHIGLEDVQVDLGPGHRGLDNPRYGEIMKDVYTALGTELRAPAVAEGNE